MKIRPNPTTPPATSNSTTTTSTTTTTTTTTTSKPTTTTSEPAADGKRFDAHSLPPPSSTVHQPQPGKRAALDLRTWQPSQLREAMLDDLKIVYDLLVKLPPAVTFFGGARIKEGDPYYAISQQIGALLAKTGSSLRTGAGPGIMTAGPEGYKAALEQLSSKATANSPSTKMAQPLTSNLALHPLVSGMTDATKTQGFRIKLPFEQTWSDAIDVGAEAKLFPYRKLALYENAKGVAVFPGGYGTLDELFEVMALSAHGRFSKPLAAVGVEFWSPVLAAIEKAAVSGRKLVPADQWQQLKVTDDPQALVDHFAQASTSTKAWERDPVARAKKLSREIEESIDVLDRLPTAVTFLGGRRLDDSDATLAIASSLASELTKAGIPLRVGSAGVVANAVCSGAAAADKDALVQGVLLSEPTAPTALSPLSPKSRDLPNLQIHQKVDELITHKEVVGRRSQAFVALPGGLNTLGEVFSILTQMQTGHLPKTPVVLVGKDFWGPIFEALKTKMLAPERKTISPEDLDLVVITDDPQAALAAMKPALKASKVEHVEVDGDSRATLFEGDNATMLNVVGPALSSWLVHAGDAPVSGKNAIAPGIAHDEKLSRAFATEKLNKTAEGRATLALLDSRGVDVRHVAWALDQGVSSSTIAELAQAGAGKETFRFMWSAAPFAAYRDIATHAKDIAARWSPHHEVLFQRFTELATSKHLQNPDALKSWLMGIAAPGGPGDGYCTMLNDAWDLVSAGHKVAVEEHATGLGDVIDLTTQTTYQHKRVLSSHLAPALKKAAEQLAGTDNAAGAPPGMRGVVHLDLRNNGHFAGLSDEEVSGRVASIAFDNSRVDVIQILLDDRLLSFGKDAKLLAG